MTTVLVATADPVLQVLLADLVTGDTELTLAGLAGDVGGTVRLALALRPDVLAVDLELPEQGGLEATRRIMAERPTPTVVVAARPQPAPLEAAVHAAGGVGMVQLEPGCTTADAAAAALLEQLKAMAGLKLVRRRSHSVRPVASGNGAPDPGRVIAVGASTGGPAALLSVLRGLPADYPWPILVVQHITAGFVTGLVRWLDTNCALTAKLATAGEPLQPATVYLAPDDRHLQLAGRRVRLSDSVPVGGFRPSATVLFDSLAAEAGVNGVGVLLTGMGSDGAAGLAQVRHSGGLTLVQSEESCVVFGMPRQAISLGAADEVLSLDQIAARLVALAPGPRRREGRVGGS